MPICKLTIETAVDGKETKIVRMGKIENSEAGIFLRYREENAEVELRIEQKTALVLRKGDYSMRLPLVEGRTSEGSLEIGGSAGTLAIRTKQIRAVRQCNKTEIILRYHLDFGQEIQDMRLRIQAQTRE